MYDPLFVLMGPLEVYLKRAAPSLPGNRYPRFGSNCSIDPARPEWIHVKTRSLPPCCVPEAMPLDGQCKVVLSDSADLVAAALKSGTLKLTVPELDDVISELGVVLPERGSGKNGHFLKHDKTRALVEHVFKDDASETDESKELMIRQLSTAKSSVTMDTENDDLLVQACAAIDPEEAKEFKHVINDCLHKIAAQKKQKVDKIKEDVILGLATADPSEIAAVAAASSSSGSGKWSFHTPEQLRCLLPGKNTLPYVYLRRNPSNEPGKDIGSFTGTYKCKSASLSNINSFKFGLRYVTCYRFILLHAKTNKLKLDLTFVFESEAMPLVDKILGPRLGEA